MDHQPVEYKGYAILPIVVPEGEDMYFGGYEISKDGKIVRVRKKILPGVFYRDAALNESVQHAKLEIENLVAMQGHADWHENSSPHGERRGPPGTAPASAQCGFAVKLISSPP